MGVTEMVGLMAALGTCPGRANRRSRRSASSSGTTGEPGTRSTRPATARSWSSPSSGPSARWPRRTPRGWPRSPAISRGEASLLRRRRQPAGRAVAIGRFAEKHTPFPMLKDIGNALADRVGAERTPEVFVLDESRAVVYRGRVDDQYAIGVHRPSPRQATWSDALEAVLAEAAGPMPRTDAVGCKIGRATKSAEGAVTYARGSSDPPGAPGCMPPARRDRPVLPHRLPPGGRAGRA